MRKLASIQEVLDIKPIEGADSIVVATVLGWKVVIKKDEFNVGDKLIYCEIDSLFPKDDERFSFLEKVNYRIKTLKLRGQISQGLCLSLDYLPQRDTPYEIGEDVTELLNIKKYEIPLDLNISGDIKGFIPGFIRKTDETRVQVLQEMLNKNQGEKCYYTEKIEGTSSTYYLNNGEYGVCGHNYEYKRIPNSAFFKISDDLKLEEKLRSLNRNLAFQGELVGDKIQGNIYKYQKGKVDWFMFSIFDIDKYEYLPFNEFIEIANQLNIKTVPILCTDYVLSNDIDSIVQMAIGNSVINPNVRREGIVIRSIERSNDISLKAINPEYLLKQK